jgi:hypothetical protein
MMTSRKIAGLTLSALFLLAPVAAQAQDTRCAVYAEGVGSGRASDLAKLLEQVFVSGNACTRATLAEELPSMEGLDQRLEDVIGQVRNGRGGASFADGAKAIQGIYLESKAYLPFAQAATIAKMYKVMAMVQLELEQQGLASEYLAASLNIDPSQTPMSFAYSQGLRDFHAAQAASLAQAPKAKVRIDSAPGGALVVVDGKAAGQTPLELELGSGPHLVQVQKEGHKSTGWLKATTEAPWNFKLEPLPGLARLDASRGQILATMAGKPGKAKAAKAPAAPGPNCPELEMNTLGTMLKANVVMVARVEEKNGMMQVTACQKGAGPATGALETFVIDGTLPARLKEKFGGAAAQAAVQTAEAQAEAAPKPTTPGLSALPPVVDKIHRTRTAVTEFYGVLMAKQRDFRDKGFLEQGKRLDTIRVAVVGILKDLDEGEAAHPADVRKAARLEAKASELWARMADTVLSVRSMEVSQKMAEQGAKEAKTLGDRCKTGLTDLAQRWKKEGRKLKDRNFQKTFTKALTDLQKKWQPKPVRLRRGQTPPPPPGRAEMLQCRIDVEVLAGQLERKLAPPPPPKPAVEPEVEPEPAGR